MTERWTHLNAAGASIQSDAVVAAQVEYLKLEQIFGGYLCAERYQSQWKALYQNIARLTNARVEQVALVESATRAMLNALLSIQWQPGDEVVVSELEYGANYVALLQLAKRFDITIRCVPLRDGELKAEDVLDSITDKTRAVLVTWVPSHNGMIAPAAAIGEQLSSFDGYYLVDACQAVGQIPVDFEALNADFLVATGRKFLRAPRGTGFLLVSDKVLERELFPLITDHFAAEWQDKEHFKIREDARRFETWEANWGARLGMKVAVEELLLDSSEIYRDIQSKARQLRRMLGDISHVELCNTGCEQSAIISFRSQKLHARALKQHLDQQYLVTSLITLDSGLLDLQHRQLGELNRVSVHTYNTTDDFHHLIEVLDKL